MMNRIYQSDIEGKPVLCFDTGLDSASFAKTKMPQCLTEPGYIVLPNGSREVWKASGVNEINESMCVWGTLFAGTRLDRLINDSESEEQKEKALQAVVFWLRAKMLLGGEETVTNPAAVIVNPEEGGQFPKGSVFFSPLNLSNRCLLMEKPDSYGTGAVDYCNCPDLAETDADAFCAGAMLYKIFSGSFPFTDSKTIYQDMRDGVFLPLHIAVPGLDKNLCDLVRSALTLPVESEKSKKKGAEITGSLLTLLMNGESNIVSPASLYRELTAQEKSHLVKENKKYLLKQNTYVRAKRFTAKNKTMLTAVILSSVIVIFLAGSFINTIRMRPTTEGMDAETVVIAYYNAFDSLDMDMMEACIKGAKKTDVNAVTSLFAISKTRQSYEQSVTGSVYTSAEEWRNSGGELPAIDVFGITDLTVQFISGSDLENTMTYRTSYYLWSPDASYSVYRTDTLTLNVDKKNNWRITDIQRDERESL